MSEARVNFIVDGRLFGTVKVEHADAEAARIWCNKAAKLLVESDDSGERRASAEGAE